MQLRWVLLVFLAACGSRLVASERPVNLPDAQDACVVGLVDAGGGSDAGAPTTQPPPAADADAGPALSAACPDGVYPGALIVRHAADIELLRGCTRVAGNLDFQTAELATLDGVESLERVDGTLSIGPIRWTQVGVDQFQPSSLVHGLAALSNLRSATEIDLIGLTLDTLAPLSKLEQVDLLMIMELRQLKDLTGLERLSFKSLDLSKRKCCLYA